MFSAELTWSPLAEEANSRPTTALTKDNASIKSRETTTDRSVETKTRRLRWPLAKKADIPSFDPEFGQQGPELSNSGSRHRGFVPYVGKGVYSVTTQVVSTKAAVGTPKEGCSSPTSEIFRRVDLQQVEQTMYEEPKLYDVPRSEAFELAATPESTPPPERRASEHRPPSYKSDTSHNDTSPQGERQTELLHTASSTSPYGRRKQSLTRAGGMPSGTESEAAGSELSVHHSFRETSPYVHTVRISESVQEEPENTTVTKTNSATRDTTFKSDSAQTYIGNLIRRMPHAPPRLMYNRLTEEWGSISDDESERDVRMEKQLWTLTALHLMLAETDRDSEESKSKLCGIPRILCHGSRVLELSSSPAGIHHLAVNYRNAHITWLAFGPQAQPVEPVPPPNVQIIWQTTSNPTSLPFLDSSFDHMQAHFLPSTYSAPKTKLILEDCFRLLVRGGVLEMLIINPIPDPNAGPKLRDWVEANLILELEQAFVGSRPGVLVPIWCREAGFSIEEKQIKFPVAIGSPEDDLDCALKCEVGRNIYREMWGRYVSGPLFWEDQTVLQECQEKGISISCTLLRAVKSDL